MQNAMQNLDKALLFSRNQVFCLKNWKLWRAPTTINFNNFCWNFAHVPYLPISTEGCVEFFLFCLELELFVKIKKDLVSTYSQKPGLSITQYLNKVKKSQTPFCRHWQDGNLFTWRSSKFSIFQTNNLASRK